MHKEVDQDIFLFVGTYPPRECGIATFTQDLTDAVDKKFSPYMKTKILAMNNNGVNVYNYPEKVMYQLSDSDRPSYISLAQKINKNKQIKIVCIQHEFGIFGSDLEERPGEYLIDFLKALNKPKILTLHSILPEPDLPKKETLHEVSKHVDEIVVMTQKGVEILKETYNVKTPIKIIPHGIPTVSFEKQSRAKKKLGYQGKLLLSSFGMINSGKGYEYVIKSLPEIVKKYPNLIYLMVGATHPVVRRNEGESYRNKLDKLVKSLNLQKHVKFYNKYTTMDEIIQFLKATDVFICSNLTPEQITSGVLSYATGTGRASIATPFLHAKDLLKEDRGVLTQDFRNPGSYTKAILSLLQDSKKVRDIEKNIYEYTRHMTWPNVAISYGEAIKEFVNIPEVCFETLPEIKVNHIKRLTDEFGMVQFAKYTSPNKNSGYTLDDNARALIVAAKLYSKDRKDLYLSLTNTYLQYIGYVQNGGGKFHDFVSKDKKINKNSWSEEAHGRAIQALGFITSLISLPKETKMEAERLMIKGIPACNNIHSPRALSSVISGLYHYNKENYSGKAVSLMKKFSDRILDLYKHNSSQDWQWFESELTYANSKICEALLLSHMATQKPEYLNVSLKTLNFLIEKTFEDNIFIPIGQDGWYKKGSKRAYYDQQPIDVSSMVQTLVLANKLTQNSSYSTKALSAFNWFLGKNSLKQVVYNESSGGCCDGLDRSGINQNQGAESTLAYLSARLTIEELA
jgi:glycosyltransferase involved in cell wall biosynthesis